MIKKVLTLLTVVSVWSIPSFASLAQKSGAEYLQEYLNEGVGPVDGFRCQKVHKELYNCSLRDYEEEGENGNFAVKSMTLRFDAKSLRPLLNEAALNSFIKNREISERIDREVEAKGLENDLEESIYRKVLEKKYLYDPAVENEVSKRLLIGLKRAEAKGVSITDADETSDFHAKGVLYINDLSKAMNGAPFDFPLLGKASLEFEGVEFHERLSRDDGDARGIKQWKLLRSITPESVRMPDRESFIRLAGKLESINGHGVEEAYARFTLENRPAGEESIVSRLDASSKEPKVSSSAMSFQIRLDRIGALLEDNASMRSEADFMLESLSASIDLEPEYLSRYRSLLQSDSSFREDTAGLRRYISDLCKYYSDNSDNGEFRHFLKSIERISDRWLRGDLNGFGLILKNRNGHTFSELAEKLFFKVAQERGESLKSAIADFVFENFSVKVYEE